MSNRFGAQKTFELNLISAESSAPTSRTSVARHNSSFGTEEAAEVPVEITPTTSTFSSSGLALNDP